METADALEDLEIALLLEAVHQRHGYDFRAYSLSAVRRRVRRRLHEEDVRTVSGLQEKVLHDPQAILFDEPLTGLDPRAIRTLKETIAERAAGGAAIVVSSHLLALVEDLCTHLLILEQGHTRFCGPMAAAREQFADLSGQPSLEEIFFRATEGQAAIDGQAVSGSGS